MKPKPKEICINCGRPKTKMVRITTIDGKPIKTNTTLDFCVNPKCFQGVDINKIKGWEIIS